MDYVPPRYTDRLPIISIQMAELERDGLGEVKSAATRRRGFDLSNRRTQSFDSILIKKGHVRYPAGVVDAANGTRNICLEIARESTHQQV